MGRKLFLAVLVAGLLALGGSAQAAIMEMDPVYFYAVDSLSDSDATVKMDITIFGNAPGTLQWSYDNSNWTNVTGSFNVDAHHDGGKQILYLRLNNPTITAGDVSYSGYIAPNLYRTVSVDWSVKSDYKVTIKSANEPDGVSPVPLPASALLLGSGLLGLALVYRRRKKSV